MMEKFYPIAVVAIVAEDGGGYLGIAPDLWGCMSHGDTPEEAFANAKDAILEWLDEARENGTEIPEPGASSIALRADRERLITKLNEQKTAIATMDQDLRMLKSGVETLKAVLATVSERIEDQPPIWAYVAVQENSHRKGGSDYH